MIPNRDPDMKKRLDFLNQVDFHIQSNSAHLQCLDLAYHNLDRYALAQYHSKHNVSVSIQKKCQGPESVRLVRWYSQEFILCSNSDFIVCFGSWLIAVNRRLCC